MSDDEPTQVYPLGLVREIEHKPGEQLYQRWFERDCWACQQGLCWQRIEATRLDGTPAIVVHGTRAAS